MTYPDHKIQTMAYVALVLLGVFTVIPVLAIDNLDSLGDESGNGSNGQRYRLEGRVIVQQSSDMDWVSSTRIVVDGGLYLGIMRGDGSFTVSNIPSGSYVIEVSHPRFVFDPTRVEINSKGKIRARTLNNIQPSAVHVVNYPLKLKARGVAPYFMQREQWRITDFLYSPMVMMMFLPLVMMFLLPKLINSQDPETQREMQQSMNLLTPKQNLPDLSEWLTQKLGGPSSGQSTSNGGAASAKRVGKGGRVVKKQ